MSTVSLPQLTKTLGNLDLLRKQLLMDYSHPLYKEKGSINQQEIMMSCRGEEKYRNQSNEFIKVTQNNIFLL